jgi:hypothetical protein
MPTIDITHTHVFNVAVEAAEAARLRNAGDELA